MVMTNRQLRSTGETGRGINVARSCVVIAAVRHNAMVAHGHRQTLHHSTNSSAAVGTAEQLST